MSRVLRSYGYEVDTAVTAGQALAIAADQRCDLVVSDIGLPDRDGIELMAALQHLYPVRGIAVTGYGEEHMASDCERVGFCAHLQKPIVLDDLLAAIRQAASTARVPYGAHPATAAPAPHA